MSTTRVRSGGYTDANRAPARIMKDSSMHAPLADAALDQIFRKARTYRRSADAWLDKPVSDEQLRQIYDLAKLGPTSANSSPARIVFVSSAQAKNKLKTALSADNVAHTMAAPATA